MNNKETSIYKVIQEIVDALRHGSTNFRMMVTALIMAGMEREDAEKMLERLQNQVDEEEE